mmetsp:Transcript_12920/g.47252  ORF Transcript_12920/g.47252 Transcript_12920/m.47252 type:complete len:247 (+) Transcript_12920:665-1405(+)
MERLRFERASHLRKASNKYGRPCSSRADTKFVSSSSRSLAVMTVGGRIATCSSIFGRVGIEVGAAPSPATLSRVASSTLTTLSLPVTLGPSWACGPKVGLPCGDGTSALSKVALPSPVLRTWSCLSPIAGASAVTSGSSFACGSIFGSWSVFIMYCGVWSSAGKAALPLSLPIYSSSFEEHAGTLEGTIESCFVCEPKFCAWCGVSKFCGCGSDGCVCLRFRNCFRRKICSNLAVKYLAVYQHTCW